MNAISENSICKAFRLSGITKNFDVLSTVDTLNDKLWTIIEGDFEDVLEISDDESDTYSDFEDDFY
jgi:hypothetical protein